MSHLLRVIKYSSVIFFLLGINIRPQNISDEEMKIKKALLDEINMYPSSTLIDIYKSFFQGFWGPGHMIPDSVSASEYFYRELKDMAEYDTVEVKKLGHYNRYVRVNMALVKNGKIPGDVLLNAFIKSANYPKLVSIDEWKIEWKKIQNILNEMKLSISHYEDDKIELNKMLSENKYVVHHSEEFVKIYKPHYRVITFEEYKKIMREFLSTEYEK